jgi:hypothetical protein
MVTIKDFTYHRNGICGEGFYAFVVLLNDEEGKEVAYLVVWTPKDGDEQKPASEFELVRFISLDGYGRPNVRQTWRGDRLWTQGAHSVGNLAHAIVKKRYTGRKMVDVVGAAYVYDGRIKFEVA